VGIPHSYGSNFWGFIDLGATIPENTRTNPTKMAPTRKNKINHSLLINTDFRIRLGATKIDVFFVM
jgi:hypothetical protein